MDWVRGGATDLSPADIRQACDDSLRRLRTDVIDLYQIHWPNRNVPMFGGVYFDPAKETLNTSIHDQLDAFAGLVKAGKVRAIGLSNETPWGLCEFVHLADQHGLPRVATVQNPYALVNRTLGFGALTGKYDDVDLAAGGTTGRLSLFDSMRKQRWARTETLAAARRYNALAREHGLTPTQMALAFCYTNWRVASTIIGVTTQAQLDENLDAWGTTLTPELLQAIDALRWTHRDPAQ
jgi:aryl-alcohol dehydrogenase-like predicted oxidoreductase